MYCKCHLIKLKVCCRIVVILHTRLDERHLIMNEIAISNLTTPPSYYPINISKQEKSRLDRYVAYLESTGRNWLSADLASYRDYLYGIAAKIAPNASLLERKAIVDEIVVRYSDAMATNVASVKVKTVQD